MHKLRSYEENNFSFYFHFSLLSFCGEVRPNMVKSSLSFFLIKYFVTSTIYFVSFFSHMQYAIPLRLPVLFLIVSPVTLPNLVNVPIMVFYSGHKYWLHCTCGKYKGLWAWKQIDKYNLSNRKNIIKMSINFFF